MEESVHLDSRCTPVLNELFVQRDAIGRHGSSPMLDERQAYLAGLCKMGRRRKSIAATASLLLHVIRLVKPSDSDGATEDDISRGTTLWIKESASVSSAGLARRADAFKAAARSWFRFLGMYVQIGEQPFQLQHFHARFLASMQEEPECQAASIKTTSLPVKTIP